MENTDNLEMKSDSFTVFAVDFLGEVVECVALEDALAIDVSHRLLSGERELDELPVNLDLLAVAIERYGLTEGASRLRDLARALAEQDRSSIESHGGENSLIRFEPIAVV